MPRWIRTNRSTASPSSLLFFDCESLPDPPVESDPTEIQRLWFGHATYLRLEENEETRRDQLTFTDSLSFWRFLLDKCQRGQTLWAFAHNIGFDLTLLKFWEDLERGEWSLAQQTYKVRGKDGELREKRTAPGVFVDGDPPTIISVRHLGGWRVQFIDTMNYWPVALRELGRSLGLPKLDMPHVAAPDRAWQRYCERDVTIIERAVCRLIREVKEQDLGRFRWSAPAQALAAWRHRLYGQPLNIDRPDPVRALERRAYYGGRIEQCFHGTFSEEVFELDVASMYPAVMRDRLYPAELRASWLTDGPFVDNFAEPGEFTAAEVLIESPDVPYPVRCRDGTFWCCGRFWSTLCGPELQRAWAAGHVQQVGQWSAYRLKDLFSRYVDYFWQRRSECAAAGDHAGEALCKLYLNSLYGKFGQRSHQWEPADWPEPKWSWGRRMHMLYETGERRIYRSVGGHCQLQRDAGEHPQSFAAIAAWVTAHARCRISDLATIAGRRNVLYVVTDALYVAKLGLLRLQDAGEVQDGVLGKLRVKCYGETAAFHGLNNYRIGTRRVLAGVKHNARELAPGVWEQLDFQGLSEIIDFPPDGSVRVRKRIIRVTDKCKRVSRDPDGWTQPLRIRADRHSDQLAFRDLHHLHNFGEWT